MLYRTILCLVLCASPVSAQWRAGYYSSAPADGGLGVDDIYYAPLTHIIHYNSFPVVTGSAVALDVTYYDLINDTDVLIKNAHNAGVRVLLSVGIGGAEDAMMRATDAAHLGAFVDTLMDFVSSHDYDGIDIDWEGSKFGPSRYTAQFENLLIALRARLDGYTSTLQQKGLLIAFFGPQSLAAHNWQYLDQVNVSCYDNFNWSFTLVWHNAALYDPLVIGDNRTCQNVVDVFVGAGVPKSKLGVGVPLYSYRWQGGEDNAGQGANYPGQILKVPAKTDWRTYAALVSDPNLWQERYMRRDCNAKVPYLSIDNPGSSSDMFVTYEDARSIADKWAFVKENQLAGIALYPLGGDWLRDQASVGAQHPLSEALRLASVSEVPSGPPRGRSPKVPVPVPSLVLSCLLTVCVVSGGIWSASRWKGLSSGK